MEYGQVVLMSILILILLFCSCFRYRREYFDNKVYETVVPRNVRLSEAPSHGIPVLLYDKLCPGSKAYFSFTDEFLNKEKTFESAA